MTQTITQGKSREELGQLKNSRKVDVVVCDDGAYPTMGTRVAREDTDGQEWVKVHGKYWKYPQQVDY